VSGKAKNGNGRVPEFMSPEWMERVVAAGEDRARRARTKEGALKQLVELGICTKTGKLTKHYR